MGQQISVTGSGVVQVNIETQPNIQVTTSRAAINAIANVENANYAAFSGNVVNPNQPNITAVGTLANLNVSNVITTGNIQTNNYKYANGVPVNFLSAAGSNGELQFNLNGNLGATSNLNWDGATETLYATNFAGNAFALDLINGANIVGNVPTVNAATFATHITGNSQPNVTSVGNLIDLTVTGNVLAGLYSGNGAGLTNINAANIVGNISANSANFANYSNFAGTAYSVAGSNVVGPVAFATTANSVAGANVSGTVANAQFANFAGTANTANIANSVSGSNVVGPVAFATTANSVSGANVVGEVAFAATANSVAGANVSGIVANANYAAFSGNVVNASQPNITSVGTLISLDVTGNVSANYFLGNGALLTGVSTSNTANFALFAETANTANSANSVSGSNVVGPVAFATTANSVSGSNVVGPVAFATTANSVSGANVSGEVANAFYAQFAGVAGSANSVAGANVSGIVANANYAAYAGNVVNASQPNITTVGTLTGINVAGDALITGNLIVDGNLTYVNSENFNVEDPIAELGGGANGAPLTLNDGKDRGAILHYYDTAPIDAFMGWDNSNAEFVMGSNVTNNDNVVTVNALGNLRVNTIIGNLNGVANSALTAATVTANSQPNITSVGTLTDLNVLSTNAISITSNQTLYLTGDGGFAIQSAQGAVITDIDAGTGDVAELGVVGDISNIGIAVNLTKFGNPSEAWYFKYQTVGNTELPAIVFPDTTEQFTAWTGNVNAANVIGTVANAEYANFAGTANTANYAIDTITANTANYALFAGTANTANSIAGANVVGPVAFATTANNVAGANVSGTVANAQYANFAGTANTANYATDAITANTANYALFAGTANTANYALFAGTANTANSVVGANVVGPVAFATTANNVAGANVSGTVANAQYANFSGTAATANTANSVSGSNVVGEVAFAATANSVAGANVSGIVANANYAAFSGNVVNSSQPNITSVGTLANLTVTGNVSANYFIGNGSLLTGIATGTSNAIVNGNSNVTVDANSNVRVSVSGVANTVIFTSSNTVFNTGSGGNITGANLVQANFFSGNGYLLTALNGSNVVGAVANATYAVSAGTANTANTANSVSGSNVVGPVAFATTANSVAGANVSGQVGNALVAGTVYTAAQPNITSLGTLTALTVNGTSNLGSNANVIITGGSNTQVLTTDGTGNLRWTTPTGGTGAPGGSNTQVQFNDDGVLGGSAAFTFNKTSNVITASGNISANYFLGNGALLTGIATGTPNAIANGTSNVTIPTANGNVVITSNANVAITATSSNVIIGSGSGANITGVNFLTANFLTGTLTTAAQPNITSVGTLTNANVSGTLAVGNGTAAAPSQTFINDTNTGIYNVGADQLGITTGGTLRTTFANAAITTTVPVYAANGTAGAPSYTFTSDTNTGVFATGTADQIAIATGGVQRVLVSNTSANFAGNVVATGNVQGNFILGNGSLLTGISADATQIINGTSNVRAAPSGNVTISVAGTSNVITVTSTNVIVNAVSQLGNLGNVKITGGTNGYFLQTDGAGNLVWAAGTVTATGNGTVAGANTQIQFNNGDGNFGATGALTFDKSSNTLTVGGTANISKMNLVQFDESVSNNASVSGTITPDVNLATIFNYTLTGNITLNALGNAVAGTSATLILKQDATGNRLLTSNALFSGNVRTLSTSANAIDILCIFYDGSTYYASLTKGYV